MSFQALLQDLLPEGLKIPTVARKIVSDNLKQALHQQGWVSREEFELQCQRLARAQAQLSLLEKKLHEISEQLPKQR